jgi:iron complex outermembrane receptor protein
MRVAQAGDVGVYMQYTRPLFENMRLNLGGRIDTVTTSVDGTKANTDLYYAYNSTRSIAKTDSYTSGTVHLSYRMPFGIELRGGVGHTVRVPDARERYFALKRKGADWVGNPNLEPSRNTGMDAGVSFRRASLLLEGTGFLNYIGDYIAVIPLSKSNPISGIMNSNARSYKNVNARIYGAEFLVSYLITRDVFLSSDLSYVRGTRDVVPEKGILTPDLAEIPPMRSTTSLRYDTGRFSAEIESIFSGAQDHVDSMLGEQRTAGYGIANLRGGINFQRFDIHIALNNLFGRSYFEHLSYQRDPFRSGARVYEPGRNFFFSISYRY